MKKLFLALTTVFLAGAFALTASYAAEKKAMTMEGYIVDTKCATANKEKLDAFAKSHDKDCALACKDSGYNLYSDGKLYKFDKKSSDKVYDFLKKADSKTLVKAEVVHEKGDMLKLVKIENAK